jgi:hypothetical protein
METINRTGHYYAGDLHFQFAIIIIIVPLPRISEEFREGHVSQGLCSEMCRVTSVSVHSC